MSTQIVTVDAKPFWKSRTIWLNAATLAAIAFGLVLDNAAALGVPDQVKIWVGILVAVVNAAANLYLRSDTVQPVALTAGQSREVIAEVPPPSPATAPPRDFRH